MGSYWATCSHAPVELVFSSEKIARALADGSNDAVIELIPIDTIRASLHMPGATLDALIAAIERLKREHDPHAEES